MKMVRMLLLAAAITTPAFALMQAYSVEPVKAAWSGKVRGDENHPVAQTVTCCWDSLEYCELFAGEKGAGGQYTATVLPAEGGNAVATSEPVSQGPNHSWVKFDEWTLTGSFTKGKTYEFRFSRAGSDSIQYYWDETDPYEYGMTTPPPCSSQMPLFCDLAMRVYALLDPVDSTYWGTNVWSCTIPSAC